MASRDAAGRSGDGRANTRWDPAGCSGNTINLALATRSGGPAHCVRFVLEHSSLDF
jgi:hypothetical protein